MFSCSSKILKKYFLANCKIAKVNTTLPSIENVKIEVKDNSLYIYSNNLELSLITKLQNSEEVEILSDGIAVLPGKVLRDIISKLPDGIIKFEKEENKLNIIGSSFKFSLSLLEEDDFPLIDEVDITKLNSIEFSQSEFKDIITKSSISISTKEQFQSLLSLYIDKYKDNLIFASTDRRRISFKLVKFDNDIPHSILVLKSSLMEVRNLLIDNEDIVKLFITDDNLIIEFDKFRYILRLIKDKFPPISDFIEKQNPIKITLNTKEFKEKLSRISVLTTGALDIPVVHLIFDKNKLLLVNKNEDLGTAQEYMDIQYDGKYLDKAYNIRYILDFLSVLNSDKFLLELDEQEQSLAIFRDTENNDFTYILAPIQE